MANLDLIVTSDSAVAHLAGGLGRPVWIALRDVPDWRWLLDREDSPWYPTARLFRQRRRGDWDEVFARVPEELARLANEHHGRVAAGTAASHSRILPPSLAGETPTAPPRRGPPPPARPRPP